MRRLIALSVLVLPLLASCGTTSNLDIAAAREFVKRHYSNPDISLNITRVEQPEYATVPKIPRDHIAEGFPDRSAACGVRVWFAWRDGRSTTHDDWLVWVSSDHKAV